MRKLTQNPETIEEYSAALRKRLAGTLPPEKIDEVVAETQAHLTDTAAELRYQADVYERQAIAHFVPVSKLSRGISRAWAPTFLRHSGTKPLQNVGAVLAVLGLTWFLSYALICSKLPVPLQSTRLFTNTTLALPFVVFVLALLACRPQLRRFLYGGGGFVAASCLLGGWLCAGTGYGEFYNNFQNISRFDAPEHYKDTLALQKFQQKEQQLLRKGINYFNNASLVSFQQVELAKLQNKIIYDSTELLKRETSLHGENSNQAGVLRARIQQAQDYRKELIARGINGYQYSLPPWLTTDTVTTTRTTVTIPVADSQGKKTFQREVEAYRSAPGSKGVVVIPNKAMYSAGISAFRTVAPQQYPSLSQDYTGPYGTGRALVAALEKQPLATTTSPLEGILRWREDGPWQLQELQHYDSYRRGLLNRDMALMASSKWRFDPNAARALGTTAMAYAGSLVLADLLGGYLGMALLKLQRQRRQARQIGLGA